MDELLKKLLSAGGGVCPICGSAETHHHTVEENRAFRRGVEVAQAQLKAEQAEGRPEADKA